MSRRTAKIVTIICVALLAILAGVWAWVNFGPKKKAPAKRPAAVAEKAPKHKTAAPTPVKKKVVQAVPDIEQKAIAAEQTLRNYGPAAAWNLPSLKDKPANQAYNALRWSMDTHAADKLFGEALNNKVGPNQQSPVCRQNDPRACNHEKDAYTWARTQFWLLANRVVGLKAKRVSPTAVKVTGTDQSAINQKSDTLSVDNTYALTVWQRSWPVSDTLTFDQQGHLTDMQVQGEDGWWMNPYLRQWDPDIIDFFSHDGVTRTVIPVKGAGSIDFDDGDDITRILQGPEAANEPGFDFTMWSNEELYGSNFGHIGAPPKGYNPAKLK